MMTPETFKRWRKRHCLTQEECAQELGFKDRRQIINYEKGNVSIPRYIWLATIGFDSLAKAGKT